MTSSLKMSEGVDPCETWREWAGPYALVAWDGRTIGPSRRWYGDARHVPYTLGARTFSEALNELVGYFSAGAVSPWWRCVDRYQRRLAETIRDGRTTPRARHSPAGRWQSGRWTPSAAEDPYGLIAQTFTDGRTHCRGDVHCAMLARRALCGLWVPPDVHDTLTSSSRAWATLDAGAPVLVSIATDDLLRMRREACDDCDGRGLTSSGPCGACGGGGIAQ